MGKNIVSSFGKGFCGEKTAVNTTRKAVPKYIQIYEWLHGMVRRGKFAVGENLPTEQELARRFQVNRMTVRKAFDKMVLEEMVVRTRGKGTVLVADTPRGYIYNLEVTTGFFHDMQLYGVTPGLELISREVCPAGDLVSRALNLKEGQKVISMVRRFWAGEEPVMIERTFMSHAEFSELLEVDLTGLRYPVLKERFNIVPDHASQTVSAVMCSPQDLDLLRLQGPLPGLLLECVVYDRTDIPVEFGQYLYRSDRYKVNMHSVEYVYTRASADPPAPLLPRNGSRA